MAQNYERTNTLYRSNSLVALMVWIEQEGPCMERMEPWKGAEI
jgi:hypothetical protein